MVCCQHSHGGPWERGEFEMFGRIKSEIYDKIV